MWVIHRRIQEFESTGASAGWTFPFGGTVLPELAGAFVLGPVHGPGPMAGLAVAGVVLAGLVLLLRSEERALDSR